jgi:hypothetical protein
MNVGRRRKRTTVVGGAPMAWCSDKGGGKIEMQLSDGESGQG